jgi:hypothetical protein
MAFDKAVAKAFGLQGDAWQRHANPWSVYTRIPIPALLVAAVWSRRWLGWWCLVPVALVVVWTFVNPRMFPPPRSMDHWASRSVLGEKYWGARGKNPIPKRHRVAPWVLTGLNGVRAGAAHVGQAVVPRPDGAALRRHDDVRRIRHQLWGQQHALQCGTGTGPWGEIDLRTRDG